MPHQGPTLEEPVNLSDLLAVGLQQGPSQPALISLEDQWSWAALDEVSNRLAAHYLALGLMPGDRFASLMPNRSALLIHYLACFKAGLVITPLNYRYMPPEIDHALQVSGARVILAHAERAADIAASKAASLPLGAISYGGATDKELSFEALARSKAPDVTLPAVKPDAPAAIFFTSGSTGPAKGVTHTHASLGWMVASASKAFELTRSDMVLAGSSISHIGGFTVSLAGLSFGAPVATARSFDHAELGPLMRKARPTLMSMLPATLLHLIREPETTAEDFSSLRLVRSAGDKVPAELETEFEELTGHKIHEGYGMTEIGLAANNPPSGRDKVGSVGVPNPGFVFLIRDDRGEEVQQGTDGRVWVKTRSQAAGYWNDPEASAEVVRDGWFDTGDVMKADEDGYHWFSGRQKQIIVHDGSNISPQEVEDAILQHPAVENAGVIGVHDEFHGEKVRAYIEIRSGVPKPSVTELFQFARARIGYKAPEEIVFLDAMPLNATGKVDRTALKQLAAADHAHAV